VPVEREVWWLVDLGGRQLDDPVVEVQQAHTWRAARSWYEAKRAQRYAEVYDARGDVILDESGSSGALAWQMTVPRAVGRYRYKAGQYVRVS
jgi:hypothetical protein